MKVALIGSGGREHALAWKLEQSRSVSRILAIPGSDAMERTLRKVERHDIPVQEWVSVLAKEKVDLVVVGPEDPLVHGLADEVRALGIPVFGPSKQAAQLEGSKAFAKAFMKRHHIPTAAYEVFTDCEAALAYIDAQPIPIVIKADGLAAGKGVVVATTRDEAKEAVTHILRDGAHGGGSVVIEECLVGEEASLLSFVDGRYVVPMVSSQDHKRLKDGDEGPNTGGMGTYAPAPVMTEDVLNQAMETIVRPVVAGMAAEGMPFVGCLYTGLMITKEGPKVIEFNVRFGDPETQVILPLLKSDFGQICYACAIGNLRGVDVQWKEGSAACVVMASAGYPVSKTPSVPITGLLGGKDNSYVFHAGTAWDVDASCFYTKGGRVLGVTAWGDDLRTALDVAYDRVDQIRIPGGQVRRDIGAKGLRRQHS